MISYHTCACVCRWAAAPLHENRRGAPVRCFVSHRRVWRQRPALRLPVRTVGGFRGVDRVGCGKGIGEGMTRDRVCALWSKRHLVFVLFFFVVAIGWMKRPIHLSFLSMSWLFALVCYLCRSRRIGMQLGNLAKLTLQTFASLKLANLAKVNLANLANLKLAQLSSVGQTFWTHKMTCLHPWRGIQNTRDKRIITQLAKLAELRTVEQNGRIHENDPYMYLASFTRNKIPAQPNVLQRSLQSLQKPSIYQSSPTHCWQQTFLKYFQYTTCQE